jgi:hypothetical protein
MTPLTGLAVAQQRDRLLDEVRKLDQENADLLGRQADDGLALAYARADLAVTTRALAEAKAAA